MLIAAMTFSTGVSSFLLDIAVDKKKVLFRITMKEIYKS